MKNIKYQYCDKKKDKVNCQEKHSKSIFYIIITVTKIYVKSFANNKYCVHYEIIDCVNECLNYTIYITS
jgi:hypothetical protein